MKVLRIWLGLTLIAISPVELAQAAQSGILSSPVSSSDHIFEYYFTPQGALPDVNGKPYLYGDRLFLRPAGSKAKGALVRENDRYMEVQWCPGTDLLGVEDHWDTHQSDVYIYEAYLSVDRITMHYRLVFRSPWNDVDHLWTIEGWDAKRRMIKLSIEQWGNQDILGHEHWPSGVVTGHYTFHIGTTALADSPRSQRDSGNEKTRRRNSDGHRPPLH